jgi:dTDP-4-amino-4,6-dideoxygalactose transaminase
MKIPYMDLRIKSEKRKKQLLSSVEQVLTHGRLILGPEVGKFESEILSICNTKHAVGIGSGTDALYLALRSLDVGQNDEVITTPLSWIATLNAIILCGAKPVFVDIGEDMNINSSLIENAITEKTKVILPVHYTGRLCNMNKITNIASDRGIYVVEDAAQAFGAHINGSMAGSFGEVSAFSMNAMKGLNAYGEAGAAVTNNKLLDTKLRSLSYAGTINKEDCHYPSLNGRMDTIQAAMLLVSLKYLDAKIKRRREIAHYFNDIVKNDVICPKEDDSFQVYYNYVIRSKQRDKLRSFLESKGIETKVHYPILMPFHTAYVKQYENCELPVAKKVVEEILSIPNHEDLKDIEVEYIAENIQKFNN